MPFSDTHKGNMTSAGELLDNVTVFTGGFLLSLTHPFNFFPLSIPAINYADLAFFTLRSLIGGAIALLVKVGAEWCIHKMKSKKKDKSNSAE